ncbi:MAG: hypothetical protein D6683_08120 [Actinomyces sp.]|nr:MAG: hypothetical protein D6683_08120 [Actinomyces sp.]
MPGVVLDPAEVDRARLEALDRAWAPARRHGALGSTPLPHLLRHAAGFVPAAWRVRPPDTLVDLGSGVGLPGLLLALLMPGCAVTLVDARARRCDWARVAAVACGVADRVTVRTSRLEDLAHRADARGGFGAAVARSLGPPPEVFELGVPLVRHDGLLVVSVDTTGRRRWEDAPLGQWGAAIAATWTRGEGSWIAVRRTGPLPAELPRPARARRSAPLF